MALPKAITSRTEPGYVVLEAGGERIELKDVTFRGPGRSQRFRRWLKRIFNRRVRLITVHEGTGEFTLPLKGIDLLRDFGDQ